MTFPVTVADLQASYHEATKNNGIIDLLQKLRGQNVIIKVDELASCFNSPQWNVRYVGGHRILTHRVTKVVIGYQSHDGQDVKMEIKKQILENAQRHMDILCDHIFKFSTYKWSNVPNYQAALQNYHAYIQSPARRA